MANATKVGAVVFVPSGDETDPFVPAVVVKAYGDHADLEVFGGSFRVVKNSVAVFATPDAVVVPDEGSYCVVKV